MTVRPARPRAGRPAVALTAALVTASVLAAAPSALGAGPAGTTAGVTAAAVTTGATETYLVLYRGNSPADAGVRIRAAGGSVVADYREIGVVVARSSSSGFATAVKRDSRVEGAAATGAYGIKPFADPDPGDGGSNQGDLPNAPATPDSLAPLQWDMRQIDAFAAHALTGGSPSVVVGNIDTGLDKDHPDLVQNIDFARSVSCESGAPDLNPAAWDDRNGHGTHTAGTIAAADNGFGITGVAPNVKIAGIKASTDAGYFFPEMVVCAFMWAGSQHLDVTNNSYYADPFLYNCRNDAVQRVIWKAEQRAIRYAMQQGVTVVASAGNDSTDRSHPTFDDSSPDFPPGNEEEREITNACVVVPLEIPGVIGVSAVGNARQADDDEDPDDYLKSFYSSYGVSAVDLTAPGGDSLYGRTPEAANGRVLSTYPSDQFCRPDRQVVDATETTSTYCYLQGTSMAGPHVAGVAALIISRYGDLQSPQNGKMRPNQVEAYLQQTADPQPCPTELPAGYLNHTQLGGAPQECQGGPGHTSWYGAGQVNALAAITR